MKIKSDCPYCGFTDTLTQVPTSYACPKCKSNMEFRKFKGLDTYRGAPIFLPKEEEKKESPKAEEPKKEPSQEELADLQDYLDVYDHYFSGGD